MRLRVKVSTAATQIPWDEVLRPGRGLIYGLMRETAPELAGTLHTSGLGPHRMTPFGHGAPVFASAKRNPGAYAAGGPGWLEMGSPMPAIVEALAKVLAGRTLIDWGGVALRVSGVDLIEPPEFAAGTAVLSTATPVVMKGSGRDAAGVRHTRQAWLLPHDAEFPAYFAQNLLRKAETLGLGQEIQLDAIISAGPKRSFAVKGGKKTGAVISVRLSGEPAILRALWSWGLGQDTAAGFGWVQA